MVLGDFDDFSCLENGIQDPGVQPQDPITYSTQCDLTPSMVTTARRCQAARSPPVTFEFFDPGNQSQQLLCDLDFTITATTVRLQFVNPDRLVCWR